MKTCREMEVQLYSYLTSAEAGKEWSGSLTPRSRRRRHRYPSREYGLFTQSRSEQLETRQPIRRTHLNGQLTHSHRTTYHHILNGCGFPFPPAQALLDFWFSYSAFMLCHTVSTTRMTTVEKERSSCYCESHATHTYALWPHCALANRIVTLLICENY